MKKILIPIFLLIIIVGISCFMFFQNNKKNDNINNETEVINKEKESNNDETIITEPKNEESIVEEHQPENKSVEHKEDNKPSNSNEKNKDNNTKKDTTVVEKSESVQSKENEWDKLGISEEDYYHKPMWSWARIDFSVEEYKTEEKTKEACVKKGQEVFEQGLGYSCTSINSYSGAYLGEMFKTF